MHVLFVGIEPLPMGGSMFFESFFCFCGKVAVGAFEWSFVCMNSEDVLFQTLCQGKCTRTLFALKWPLARMRSLMTLNMCLDYIVYKRSLVYRQVWCVPCSCSRTGHISKVFVRCEFEYGESGSISFLH